MPAAALDRPPIRLAQRHRLSRARGLVVGIVAGLILWSVIAGLLYEWL